MILRSLAFALFALLLQLAPARAQTVTLSPTAGPQTKVVTVTGTGFGANQVVDVYFDLTQQCMTFANASGAFSCAVTVPANAQPGTHWISAIRRSNSTGAQKSFLVRTNWTQYHGRNAFHTGANRFETVLNTNTATQLDLFWRVQLGTSYSAQSGNPIIVNGRLYVGTSDGLLHGLDAKTGAPLAGWPKQAGPAVRDFSANTPTFANGRIYIGGRDGKLYAFQISNGAAPAGFPFTVTSPQSTGSPPTPAPGKILIGFGSTVFAVNVTGTPSLAWSYPTGSTVYAAPTVVTDRVYIAAAGQGLHAVALATGASVSGFPVLGDTIYSTPAAAQGNVYFYNHTAQALEGYSQSGFGLSGFPVSLGVGGYSSPVVNAGIIYIGTQGTQSLHAIRASNGTNVWTKSLTSSILGTAWANNVLYVSSPNALYALASNNGTELARISVDSTTLANPVVNDGIVYLMSTDGYLYAFAPNGSDPAKAPARGQPGAPSDQPPALSSLVPNPQIAITPAVAQ